MAKESQISGREFHLESHSHQNAYNLMFFHSKDSSYKIGPKFLAYNYYYCGTVSKVQNVLDLIFFIC